MNSATAASAQRHSRRTYLIDRGFQLKYTLVMMVVGAAISLLFGAMMYQAHLEITELLSLSEPARATVAAQNSTLLWLVVSISLVMALALGLFGVILTHRIAGPIYVFSHYMAVLGEGRFPKVRPLRKSDELGEFHDVFARAVAHLRERERAEGKALQEIAQVVEAAAARAGEDQEGLRLSLLRLKELSAHKLAVAAGEGGEGHGGAGPKASPPAAA
jgi:methyl-accepting chemotaxis protein